MKAKLRFFYVEILFNFLKNFVCVHFSDMYVPVYPVTYGCHKRAANLLDQELQIVVSSHVGMETRTWVL